MDSDLSPLLHQQNEDTSVQIPMCQKKRIRQMNPSEPGTPYFKPFPGTPLGISDTSDGSIPIFPYIFLSTDKNVCLFFETHAKMPFDVSNVSEALKIKDFFLTDVEDNASGAAL